MKMFLHGSHGCQDSTVRPRSLRFRRSFAGQVRRIGLVSIAGLACSCSLLFVSWRSGQQIARLADSARHRSVSLRAVDEATETVEDLASDLADEYWGRERLRLEDLEVGQELTGVVQSIQSYGCFVDVGADVDGLVHISRISEDFVENIDDVVQPGQEVHVWVSQLSDDGKLGLSMIENFPGASSDRAGSRGESEDRASEEVLKAFKAIPETERLPGVVKGIVPFGVFVEVALPSDPDVSMQGLVHITQLRDHFVEDPADEVEVEEEVTVRVIGVDMVSGRLSLSMRQPTVQTTARRESDDISAFEAVAPDTWLTGRVHHTVTYGVFVEVAPPGGGSPAQGLVHVTQIKDGFVDDPAAEVDVGEEVRVRVTDVDTYRGRLALSMLEP
eukprot:TRINITY_DN57243_c0_g1_i1.p1 TRINITY_DN57243_c0_g1~~TRINITY_DN57243_c0_g1_i1.p1  ORF type:complete len:387 (-),score=80.77 TRINITY_DN57243_c0_g1_i1:45-1205(-)